MYLRNKIITKETDLYVFFLIFYNIFSFLLLFFVINAIHNQITSKSFSSCVNNTTQKKGDNPHLILLYHHPFYYYFTSFLVLLSSDVLWFQWTTHTHTTTKPKRLKPMRSAYILKVVSILLNNNENVVDVLYKISNINDRL